MEELTIAFQPAQVRINGELYDVLRSEADIFDDMIRAETSFKAVKPGDAEGAVAAARDIVISVDKTLGKGAWKKITGGVPVGVRATVTAYMTIMKACSKGYAAKLAEYE